MATPKILVLLSGFSNAGVGEQFLEAMLQGYDAENIVRYSPVTGAVPDTSIRRYKSICKQVPYSKYPGLSHLTLSRFVTTDLPEHIVAVEQLIQQESIDLVWVFLNSWYTIQIAGTLSEKIAVPMVTHIWDAPEYIASKILGPPSYKRSLLAAFAKAMNYATAGVTVSRGMSEEYLSRYDLPCREMVYCPPMSSWRAPQEHKRDYVHIVFAGSLYAYGQWNALLDAVEYNNKQSEGRKIKVTCIGQVSRWARRRKWVVYEALKPASEAATAVNDADIAYLPYWMSRKHAYFVRMAFPGKMSFYTAAGTPILYHGPEVSTPTAFLQAYAVGVACHSNDPQELLDAMSQLIGMDFRSGYVTAREETLQAVFHPQRCVDIFEETLKLALSTRSISNR